MTGVRKVVTRSPHRRVGFIACLWFQPTSIEYESLLERDFVRLALLDLEVSLIDHQPFSLDLGELGTYIPDFLLSGPEKKLVIEVKPDEHASSSRNKPRLARAAQLLREKGYRFMVATEKYVHADTRHERAAILLRHARSHLSDDFCAHILAIAAQSPRGLTISALAAAAGAPTSAVLHLIGRRRLTIAKTLAFDDAQKVYPIGGQHGSLHS